MKREGERSNNARPADSADVRIDDALIEKLLRINDITVPQDLVDDEVSMMVVAWNHQQKYESLASGGYLSLTQEEIAALMEEFKAEALQLVKTRLVIQHVIAAEHLEVTREELEEEAQAIAVRQQTSVETVKGFLGADLAALRGDLLVRKAVDLINIMS